MPKLTKTAVERLRPKAKDYLVFDDDLPGFGVRVMPSGKRSFLIQYKRDGRTRRVMIGMFGPVTAEQARRQALRLLGQVKGAGADPANERDAARKAVTMTELGVRFLEQHVKVRCKPTTQYEYARSVNQFITPHFKRLRVREVTTADVAEWHVGLARTPYQANRSLGVLSKMMNLAELWGLRDRNSNPCEQVERYPEKKRERFLTRPELNRLGEALEAYEQTSQESLYAVAAFRLLLLTGCRLREIQTLQWEWVDLQAGELRLPDSKTGAKTVHIGDAAVEVLKQIPRLRDNPWVIAGKKPGARLTDLERPWRKIREIARLDDVRIHDLRHTFASGALELGEALPMIGRLLGHTQVQTTARYAHLAATPVKEAATKVADSLSAALGRREPSPANSNAVSAPQAPPPQARPVERCASPRNGLAALRSALDLVVEDPALNGGEPTFQGTRLLVAPVATLVEQGLTLEELQEDYPRLTSEMLEAARVLARAQGTANNPAGAIAGQS